MKTIIAAVVAIAVIAAGGWYFWQQNNMDTPAPQSSSTASTASPSTAPSSSSKPPTAANEKMKITAADKKLGSPNAPVTIVEYASMTCPHCAAFHAGTYPELKKKYIDTGKVMLVFRDFPFDQLAFQASVLAHCSGDDAYFTVTGIMFKQQGKWSQAKDPKEAIIKIGQSLGISRKKYESCLADEKLGESILTDRLIGQNDFKVNSTPTLFINGKMAAGNQSFEALEKLIKPLL